jgi:5-methylcytosine-specific restriction protein B
VILPYSGEKFSVPPNVDIYGSMNTADRSLALLDTALRRRFEFVSMSPRPDLLENISTDSGDIDLAEMLKIINDRIEVLYDRDHCIGHAYFMPIEGKNLTLDDLKNIFRNKIIPLLTEYFFEDWHKVRLVLGDNQKLEDFQFIHEEKVASAALFGEKNDLDDDSLKPRFKLNEDAFDKPETYIGIYSSVQ